MKIKGYNVRCIFVFLSSRQDRGGAQNDTQDGASRRAILTARSDSIKQIGMCHKRIANSRTTYGILHGLRFYSICRPSPLRQFSAIPDGSGLIKM
ncbi:hypothetical protein XELAEV_18039803mg [Xenopus laevis]|uniref:Uncharacterized protein n=1 Tax=Xenopus laevis TaxID=8355 RepID=A0A974C8E1_XENLA|nr:hypothetical protein XELAEV_18039803mg [Xenopus laevis]